MAYAAYRESFDANSFYSLPPERRLPQKLVVLDVTVASRDAFQVRRWLAGWLGIRTRTSCAACRGRMTA